MAEIGFYHLIGTPLEQALPKLLEKTLAADKRALVVAGSPERVEALNVAIWTYGKDSWIPHGSKRDGFAERQPIYLTDGDENPNAADFLFLTDGADGPVDSFERCFVLFDGKDVAAVDAARNRWRDLKAAGHTLTYWQQTSDGNWEKKT